MRLAVRAAGQGRRIPESRIGVSVRRILRDKFRLGLYDDPYVDKAASEDAVARPEHVVAGAQAQRRAIALLKNGAQLGSPILPLGANVWVYLEGIDREVARRYATVVSIFLERPAVIPELAESAAALLGNFGASDEALLDVVFGAFAPTERLPFELPSSMEAVRAQKEDVPFDSERPLFPFGFGLSYEVSASP
jgi:beta-glucosidase